MHAALRNPPGFLPCRHSFPVIAPCASILPMKPCSCANSQHFGFLFAGPQSHPGAGLLIALTGPHMPLPPPSLPATQSFADSARSVHLHELLWPHQSRSASKTDLVSVQIHLGRVQSLIHRYSRCTNRLTSLRQESAF